jgi:hypothetical protein
VPGFWTGLTGVAARGAVGIAEGEEDATRKMLAAAARKRQETREDEESGIRRMEAIAKARDAGLIVSPQAGERSGDQSPTTNPVGPSITQEAGPAATKAKPTRVGSVGGMDISVPEGPVVPKSVRDKQTAIAAGIEKAPEQTLHGRIIELRGQGMKPEDAIAQARQEYGLAPIDMNPIGTFTKKRRIEASIPVGGGNGSGGTPERRAAYILRRASQLTQPKKVGYRVQPGLDRAAAEAQAGDEYDRVHGVDAGGDINLGSTGHASKPAPAPSKVAQPTAGAQPNTPHKVDEATLRAQAKAAIDAGADPAAVNARLQQKLKGH